MTRVGAHWRGILATMTARGFASPPFKDSVWGPIVEVGGDDPPCQLREATIAAFVKRTLRQDEKLTEGSEGRGATTGL